MGGSYKGLLFLGFLFCLSTEILLCNGESNAGCFESEREALTKFRIALDDPFNLLSAWEDPDCCKWREVTCDNETGYVIKLDLHSPDGFTTLRALGGQLDPALLQLKHLHFLDLSENRFIGNPIPEFLGSLKELRYLNLSYARFSGRVPSQLGNLSKLEILDLSSWFVYLHSENLQWLTNLHSLKHLEMNSVNLSIVSHDWVHVMSRLPSLVKLHLENCGLTAVVPSLSFINFTSLRVLDLRRNNFMSTIPIWIANISSLVSLDISHSKFQGFISLGLSELPSLQELNLEWNSGLIANCSDLFNGSWKKIKRMWLSYNEIHGEIPFSIGNVTSLVELDLSNNIISGAIPSTIGKLGNLKILNLFNCMLSGPIPPTVGLLSELTVLILSSNQLVGVVSEIHFEKLSNLKQLWMHNNSLVFDLPPDWVPPFQLKFMSLELCHLGPRFPMWVQTQKSLTYLAISNTSITGTIPVWFWDFIPQLEQLDLSSNMIDGQLPNVLTMQPNSYIDLSLNLFGGPIPHAFNNITIVDLSDNRFIGPIPPNITQSHPGLSIFFAQGNQLNGTIPLSIGEMEYLNVLDLSRNRLSGPIPLSLGSCSDLEVLDLSRNNLSGQIPPSIGLLGKLKTLHLNSNNLSRELPLSLRNCYSLETLDLGENKFLGNIPSWIGENLASLRVLRLRSNMFTGAIPPQLSNITSLQVLDVANNFLSGSIPPSFGNFSAMKSTEMTNHVLLYGKLQFSFNYEERLLVVMNGQSREYSRTLSLVTCIDLSGNYLSGEIPESLTTLHGLIVLNLSRNHLTGKITEWITNLRELMSLDFSENQLSGELPPSMTSLTFLSYVNFSSNNFSGKIPSGNQFSTFEASAFSGNPNLCGLPLTNKCMDEETTTNPLVDAGIKTMKDRVIAWFDIFSVILGFVVGLAGAWFVLKLWNYSWLIRGICSA